MGSKVLLADDSVTIQKVVGIIFANEDYDLTIVSGGEDATRKAVEIKPDALLIDALMPGKNGYEVCREIRQNPNLSHIAILLMTGAFEAVDEEKNRLSGADEFIIKPFESQALIDATNRMIALTAQRAASPAAPQAAPQPAAPAPVAAPSVDDVWATGFDMEPAVEAEPAPVFAAPPVQPAPAYAAPVKATSDDDIWGAFDMDSVEAAPPPVQIPAPVAATAADDFFSFEVETPKAIELPEEDEFVLEDEVLEPSVPAPAPAPAPAVTGFEPVGEEEISFADEEPLPVEEIEVASIPTEDDFSTICFDEPASAPTPVPPAPVAPIPAAPAPLPPIVEAAPPAPPVAPVVPPAPEPVYVAPPVAPAPVAPAPAAVPAALDEATLRTLLSTVSREMIERIVWEVVPDLAEAIIKEEIRKLKAGIA